MKKHVLKILITGLIFFATHVIAEEINLHKGETYREGNLTVTCSQPLTNVVALALKNCQYWDKFNEKCLFEITTYTYKNLECIEECQHWDKFFSTCHYQTKCSFYPAKKLFVRTTCDKYDDFNKTCVKTSNIRIGP